MSTPIEISSLVIEELTPEGVVCQPYYDPITVSGEYAYCFKMAFKNVESVYEWANKAKIKVEESLC